MKVEWYESERGNPIRPPHSGVSKTKFGLFFSAELFRNISSDYVQVGWNGTCVIIKPVDKSNSYSCKKVSHFAQARALRIQNAGNKCLSAFGRWLNERLSDGRHLVIFNEAEGWYEIQPEGVA